MCDSLSAPEIRNYIDWLGRIHYRSVDDSTTYDERTYELLDELFALLKQIKPVSENGIWELWLSAERGSIEKFGSYEEYLEDGEVDSYDEFERLWLDCFPEEISWYHFAAVKDKENDYRAVFLGHKHVLEQDRRKGKGIPQDISEFAQWLVDSVKNCIAELEAGLYNERVERELPPQHRTGTIQRKDLWDIFPKSREEFFQDISPEEVQEFLHLADEQASDPEWVKSRQAQMTANDFFRCCALGYQANNYEGSDLPPREQYKKHADGRDDGLLDIAPDSEKAFHQWLHHREQHGGHPWEICRGGNSTHISLYVYEDDGGYYLVAAGSAWRRTIETVNTYLALKKAGWPVYLHEADLLAARLREEEKIGIVPEGVFPAYCHSLFPEGGVIDFMNLPRENREQIAEKCVWRPLTQIERIESNL